MTTVETATARTSRRIAFAPFSLKRLPVPSTGQEEWTDISTAGLGLRISHKGTRTWTGVIRLKGSHTRVRFTIGRASIEKDDGGLSLADARTAWAALKKRIARGEDPRQTEAREQAATLARNADTFHAVAERFIAARKKEGCRSGTLKRYTVALLGDDVAPWHARPMSSLTRADVIALIDRMHGKKKRTLDVVRNLMHWAIGKGLIETAPTDHIKSPTKDGKRKRHLYGSHLANRPNELGLLWWACDRIGRRTQRGRPLYDLGALVKLMMATGQREDEVVGMRDEELIDLDGSDPRWLIPEDRAKIEREQLVPLPPLVVEILRGLPRFKGCPYFFTTNGRTPFSGFSNFKKRIDRELAAIKKAEPTRYGKHFTQPWVFHDLRRTVKTGLGELGITGETLDALLNHAKKGIDAHYNHAEYWEPKKAAMVTWEQHLRAQIDADRPK